MPFASSERVSEPVASLADGIGAACAAPIDAFGGTVTQLLSTVATEPALLLPHQRRGRADRYMRHVLHADPAGRFTIVSIVWRPGQATPIHGHYTWCSFVVATGSLREDEYRILPGRRAAQTTGHGTRTPGYVSFTHASADAAHRICNSSDHDAASVHVYGIDGPRVGSHVNRVVPTAQTTRRNSSTILPSRTRTSGGVPRRSNGPLLREAAAKPRRP